MKNDDLRDYLFEQIPLAKAIGMEIKEASSDRVVISAPLGPNSNHMDTAFGGSLATILILACYSYLFNRLEMEGFESHVLIKDGHTQYHQPIREDLTAICYAPDKEVLAHFLKVFERRGKARIKLEALIQTDAEKSCTFTGEFVAVKA